MRRAEAALRLPRIGGGLAVVAMVVLVPPLVEGILSDYWVTLCIVAAQTALVLLSAGLLIDRAGMLSVAPLSFAGVGAWAIGFFNVHHWPGGFMVWLLLAGLAAVPFGLVVGLPALRLRGINLAVITLSFAVAASSVMNAVNFPGTLDSVFVERPGTFESDNQYFTLCWIAFAVGAVVVWGLGRRRAGTAWRAVARSERATAAMGISVVRTKLGAFVLSAFMAGVAGALMVGQVGTGTPDAFTPLSSLSLVAVGIMVGAGYPEGAVVGGAFSAFSPEIMRRIGLPQDFGNIFFAVGAIQVLKVGTSMAGGWRATARKWSKRRRRPTGPLAAARSAGAARAPSATPAGVTGTSRPALRTRNLTVRFGNVVALDSVDLEVPPRTVCGLIGPNGAGKSTLVDAVTGFLRGYDGSVELEGTSIDSLTVHRRVRAGVRRTFQTERTVPQLSVRDYVRLASRRRMGNAEIAELLAFLDGPDPALPIAEVDVGARRVVELAGAVAAPPKVVLLDEPAAGLGQAESVRLAQRIAELPERIGCAVLLIEHDMEVVAAACGHITVLDFGKEIAHGAPSEVLELGAVVSAYLGEPEVTV